MKCRSYCVALTVVLFAFGISAHTQVPQQLRVAWVSIEPESSRSPYIDAFLGRMRELGYTEGKNLIIDKWWGDGSEQNRRNKLRLSSDLNPA